MSIVSRKAIIIGCPGNKPSFLPGVARDLKNVKGYLMSDKGGRWYSDGNRH